MAEDNGFAMGYALGQDSAGGNSGSGGFGGMFGEGLWAIIILAMLGFGGYGGGFGGFGGGAGLNGALTRAELYDGFAMQNIDNAVRGVQQGICDSTYALNSSISSGFHGVDSAICNQGYRLQSEINGIGHQISDCCCATQRAIDGVKYDMASQFCGLGNTIQSTARDIIDNQNANYRGLMDFLVSEKLASKDARIAELTNQLSQSQQNGVIRAAIDASTAEIIRKTGNDCPTPAYWVNPPTPVQAPYGWGQRDGCGCGGY